MPVGRFELSRLRLPPNSYSSKSESRRCGDCEPWNAARLRQAIGAKAVEFELTRFLTLPFDPARIPPDVDPVKYLRGMVWAKFRTYLKRRYKKLEECGPALATGAQRRPVGRGIGGCGQTLARGGDSVHTSERAY